MKKVLEILLNSAISAIVLFIVGVCIKYVFINKIEYDLLLIPVYFILYLCVRYMLSNKSDIKLSKEKTINKK